jgi:hypothetical protein
MKFLRISDQEMYKLEVDFNSMCLVEEVEGKGAEEVLSAKNIGFRVIRSLLYGALSKRHPEKTLENSGEIAYKVMKSQGLQKLVEIVMAEYKEAGFIGDVEVEEKLIKEETIQEDAKKN